MRIVPNQNQYSSSGQSEDSFVPNSSIKNSVIDIQALAPDESSTQHKLNVESIPVTVRVSGAAIILQSIENQSTEELEQALLNDSLGTVETDDAGLAVLKFPEQRVKELESLGVTSVQFHGPSGVQTFSSFNIQALSDKELNLLITKVKTYIVYLKAQTPAEDTEAQKAIEKLEHKLAYLETERGIRTRGPQLKQLLELQKAIDSFAVATRLSRIWAEQRNIQEKREEVREQNYWDNKHFIQLKDETRIQSNKKIAQEIFLKQEIAVDTSNKAVEASSSIKSIINIGRFIDLFAKSDNAG